MLGQVTQPSKLQVVTKTIQKSYEWQEGVSLSVQSELADLDIKVWDKPNISIELKLVAKHPDRETAESDLKRLQFAESKQGKIIYIRNYTSTDKSGSKPKANLRARYVIWMPAKCPLNADNQYGALALTGLRANVALKGEFSNFVLNNIQSNISIQSSFGDVKLSKVIGGLTIISDRADIALSGLQGSGNIKADYANITVSEASLLTSLSIKAKHSDVHFNDEQDKRFNYDLLAANGTIVYPNALRFKMIQNGNTRQAQSVAGEGQPTVQIQTSDGSIRIE